MLYPLSYEGINGLSRPQLGGHEALTAQLQHKKC